MFSKCQNIWLSLHRSSHLIFLTREQSTLTVAAASYQGQSKARVVHTIENERMASLSGIHIFNFKIEEAELLIYLKKNLRNKNEFRKIAGRRMVKLT